MHGDMTTRDNQSGTTKQKVELLDVARTEVTSDGVTNEVNIQPTMESKRFGVRATGWIVAVEGTGEFASRCGLGDDSSCAPDITVSSPSGQEYVTYAESNSSTGTPLWRRIMNAGLLGMAGTGVVANTLTFVTLTINGRAFSRLTAILLRHQALIDAAVCALASGVFMQTSVWHVGQYAIDYAVCFVWHSQYIYWAMVLLSVWNLVFIAVDRLIAVCFPIKYKSLSPCARRPPFDSLPSSTANATSASHCPLDLAKAFYYWFSVYWLFVAYIVPMVSFLLLYGRTVLQLRRQRFAVASATHSQTLTKSTIRVTKCAITVTVIFAATISYDSIYFCLGNVGATSYELGKPVQLVGILMTVCNSLANPFMYAIFMPTFRRSLRRTICRRGNAVHDEGTTVTVGSTV
ncbi:hypothetical protein NP493_201g02032 [Ridgeia piscesae]|uniref:G-protein coupled receptors family 1 profile domain-containing protein n=1 Tax=Ridgeia piscesae TaxID=27915 RepID=A0AAD9P1T4_RIDPI|nr:hypothetical protein NP493_201g02032 [Ridgeia piscesae]